MSITKFKFVSPGIFIDEIDKSQLPTTPDVIGPVVIGRSVRGPAMRPVKVADYSSFVEVFGEPNPGSDSPDAWRSGNKSAPTYGAYAAKAYLANNGPLTFVRLLGYQHDNLAVGQGEAGWSISNTLKTTTAVANGGTFGLFIVPITSSTGDANTWEATALDGAGSSSHTTGTLAAVFYVNNGTVQLTGLPLVGTSETSSAGHWIRATTAGTKAFKLKISSSIANETTTIPFNFTPTSKEYIRYKFNTNPVAVNTSVTEEEKAYWLGETFTSNLEKILGSAGVNQSFAAAIVALESGSINFASQERGAVTSETGWFVSQDFGQYGDFQADATTGEYAGLRKLFKVVSLTEGEWNQNNLKISISDIAPSTSPFIEWGTFTLTVRKMEDNDINVGPLEVFTGLTLDPTSPNYIVKRIGDSYSTWNYSLKRYVEYGEYPNASKFIRVVVDEKVKNSQIEKTALPMGFYAPRKISSINLSGTLGAYIPSGSFAKANFYGSWNPLLSHVTGGAPARVSLQFPELPFIESSTADSPASVLEQIYWGVKTNLNNTKIVNQDLADVIKITPVGISDASFATTAYGTLFTLDDVMFKDSIAATEFTSELSKSVATWAVGNRKAQKSISSKTDFIAAGSLVTGYAGDNFQKIARFTVPLVGGFDGLDITEKEPFSQRSSGPINDSSTQFNSYAFNSVNVAIDAVSDAEVVEANVLTVPGIWNKTLTNKVLTVCESRGDMLGIIDLEGDYKSEFESTLSAESRKPSVTDVVNKLKDRFINNSYGCAFFPAVLARDNSAGALVSMPSSIVALGTLASSAARSELWFAPAGFNRGGLSQGAAGFPVVAVKYKLTAKERDKLYEANINPIASFPAEGIVVFGQKTLQVTPSALDRINVRRLMIYVKKEISRMASTVLFDPNTSVTWGRFLDRAVPFLNDVKSRFGLTDFRVVLDETTTTPELVDRNIVYAKIFLKPTRAIEFIALDFIITNTGASFAD